MSVWWTQRRHRVPWRAILLALVLFAIGSVLLVLAAQQLKKEPTPDNAYPLLVIGILTFLPGEFSFFVTVVYDF